MKQVDMNVIFPQVRTRWCKRGDREQILTVVATGVIGTQPSVILSVTDDSETRYLTVMTIGEFWVTMEGTRRVC